MLSDVDLLVAVGTFTLSDILSKGCTISGLKVYIAKWCYTCALGCQILHMSRYFSCPL